MQALVARASAPRAPLHIAIIGAGAGGSSAAGSGCCRGESGERRAGTLTFVLVTDGDTILPSHAPAVRPAAASSARARHRAADRPPRRPGRPPPLRQRRPHRRRRDAVRHRGAAAIAAATRARARRSGARGARQHPAIFAAGDAAHLVAAPREKAGVYAVRQGGGAQPAQCARRWKVGALCRAAPPSRVGTGDDYAASRGAWSAGALGVALEAGDRPSTNHLPTMAAAPGEDAARAIPAAATCYGEMPAPRSVATC